MKKALILLFIFFIALPNWAQTNRTCQQTIDDLKRNNRHLNKIIDRLENLNDNLKKELSRHQNINGKHQVYNRQRNDYERNQNNIVTSNSEENKIVDYRLEIANSLTSYPATLARKIELFNNTFDTYIIDLRDQNQSLNFLWRDRDNVNFHSLYKVQQKAQKLRQNLVFAINGGMYDPNSCPLGLFVSDGIPQVALDRKQGKIGNFYMQPNGIFLINKQGKAEIVRTEEFVDRQLMGQTLHATQSGPMLLINGNYHQRFNKNSNNLNIRNGVGIIDENRIVFAISKRGVTFYDFATLFKDVFNCKDALFLDGNVSKMYCPELGRYDSDGDFGAILELVKY